MNLKIRHLTSRPGAVTAGRATTRWYWTPSPQLRAAGWKQQRLKTAAGAWCATRAEAAAAADIINREVDAWRGGLGRRSSQSEDGTLAALIDAYRRSDYFARLAPKTKKDYDWYLEIIRAWSGAVPVRAVTRSDCATLYRELAAKTPRKASYTMAVLHTLFDAAELLYKPTDPGFLASEANPAVRLKMTKGVRGGRIWTREAVDAFVAAADAVGRHSIGTAVVLNEWIGQREGDVIALPRTAWSAGTLYVKQSKTGARVELPVDIVPHLVERLEQELALQARRSARRSLGEGGQVTATTLIVNEETGRPYTADTFREWVARIRARAAAECPELAELEFRHLRHTAVTRMAAAGVTKEQISRVTGHSLRTVDEIAEHYLVHHRAIAAAAFRTRLEKEGR